MSKRTHERRAKVGRAVAPETAEVLNSIADLQECDQPDSPKQLESPAKVEDKTEQAEIARRVAQGDAKDVFEAKKQVDREAGRDRRSQRVAEITANNRTGCSSPP